MSKSKHGIHWRFLLVLASKNKVVLNKTGTLSGSINFIFLHTKANFRCMIKGKVVLHQLVYLTRLIITLYVACGR